MKTSTYSLRAKLTGAFLVPTLVIILLYGLLTYYASRQGLEDELGRRLIGIAQTVAAPMSDGFDAQQISRLDASKVRVRTRLAERLNAVRQETGVRRIFLVDPDKRSLVDTDESAVFGDKLYALEADDLELEGAFEGQGKGISSVLFRGSDGRLYKAGYAPVRLEDQVIAVVGVEASAEYFDLLRYLATVLTVLGALGILLVIVVGTLVSRRITRPVNDLVDAARRLGRGEFEDPILDRHDQNSNDEIRFLGEAFEDMRRDIIDRDRQMQMMLSGIAHEVRNPLGGMKLFVGLLEEDLREKEGTEAEIDKVHRIERELGYLDRVVSDFLDFAREVPPVSERFSATAFLTQVDDLMNAECDAAGARLNVSTPAGMELTGDEGKLRRAVINCVRNAYQACADRGQIVIEIDAPDDLTRRIMIRDDGPGIPREKLEEVLTPFFTTKEKGSGLGLSLTRRIVEEHGGKMTIESDDGAGTTIVFEIPFDDALETTTVADIPEGWLG